MTHRQNRPTIEIWTDGSVQPANPGPHGGWAAVLSDPAQGRLRAISGYFKDATNQRAEAYAFLNALKALTRPCTVKLFTDSMYVIHCYRRMQKKAATPPKSNSDIWRDVAPLLRMHNVQIEFVKGHNHNEMNDWADVLAYNASHLFHGDDKYYTSVPCEKRKVKA